MYGYYILQDQNPALLERQRQRNEARAAAFYAAVKPLREALSKAIAESGPAAAHGLAFLQRHIRTSLLSLARKPSISGESRRYTP